MYNKARAVEASRYEVLAHSIRFRSRLTVGIALSCVERLRTLPLTRSTATRCWAFSLNDEGVWCGNRTSSPGPYHAYHQGGLFSAFTKAFDATIMKSNTVEGFQGARIILVDVISQLIMMANCDFQDYYLIVI